jgi:hypothetical protein
MIGCGPSTNQVDGILAFRPVVGATSLLTIHGDNLAPRGLENGLYPGDKAGLELLAIDSSKDPAKGVMRWSTVLQFQKLSQPVEPFVTEQLHVIPGLSATDDSADGNHDDIDQAMVDEMLGPWVFQISEMLSY